MSAIATQAVRYVAHRLLGPCDRRCRPPSHPNHLSVKSPLRETTTHASHVHVHTCSRCDHSYASRESATRNVLLAYSYRNPAVGYCQSLNFITGALLMAPLTEEDAFFSLVTIIEDLMPPDYYTRDDDLLGARIDQLVFAELLAQRLPRLTARLDQLHVPLDLFSLQWFMCLFAKDLPLSLVLRVWDVMFVYGDHAIFAAGLAILQLCEAPLLSCASLEEMYESLKCIGSGLLQRDSEAAHRVVLQSLDSLMRTPLVERVEAGRTRFRLQHAEQLRRRASIPAAAPEADKSGEADDEVAPQAPSDADPDSSAAAVGRRGPAKAASPASAAAPTASKVSPTSRRRFDSIPLPEERVPPKANDVPYLSGRSNVGQEAQWPGDAAHGSAGGVRALNELLYFLRRNEMLLRQRRETLEAKNVELRAQIAARGLHEPRTATASFLTALAINRDDSEATAEATEAAAVEGEGAEASSVEMLPPAAPGRDVALLPPSQSSISGGVLSHQLQWYDAVLDVQAIAHVLAGGWALRLSPWARYGAVDGDRGREVAEAAAGAPEAKPIASVGGEGDGWGVLDRSEAVRVGVLGLFNGGKTFVLNQLFELQLPSSRRVATRGISLRRAPLGGCLHTMLIDTEGSYAPVQSQQPGAMAARLETEALIEHLTVRLSDYLLYVVDDFTSVDQRAVHRLCRLLSERRAGFAELIVIHNMRTVADEVAFEHMWRTRILDLYGTGEELSCLVPIKSVEEGGAAAADGAGDGGNGEGPASVACQVRWFKTQHVRHVALVSEHSALGKIVNPGSIALVRQWIHSAFVPSTNGRPPLFAQLVSASEAIISESIKNKVRLTAQPSADASVRLVRAVMAGTEESTHDAPRRAAAAARQAAMTSVLAVDSPTVRHTEGGGAIAGSGGSGSEPASPALSSLAGGPLGTASLLLPRAMIEPTLQLLSESGAWLPHVDLIEGSSAFVVLVDVPSLSAGQIAISRSGSHTRVRGERSPPYGDGAVELRGERLYGSFRLVVRVPDHYEKRWQTGSLDNGVLRLSYRADEEPEHEVIS